VNPGAIKNHMTLLEKRMKDSLTDDDLNKPYPCVLVFDALSMQASKVSAQNIRKWLNAEWKRLKLHDGENEAPFTAITMSIHHPWGLPRQMHGFDSGVFLFRYAYGLIRIRSRMFSYAEAGFDGGAGALFKALITKDEAFQFGMDDIDRIRGEMKILIERLSKVYLPWHAEQVRTRKARHSVPPIRAVSPARNNSSNSGKVEVCEENVVGMEISRAGAKDVGGVSVSSQILQDTTDDSSQICNCALCARCRKGMCLFSVCELVRGVTKLTQSLFLQTMVGIMFVILFCLWKRTTTFHCLGERSDQKKTLGTWCSATKAKKPTR